MKADIVLPEEDIAYVYTREPLDMRRLGYRPVHIDETIDRGDTRATVSDRADWPPASEISVSRV